MTDKYFNHKNIIDDKIEKRKYQEKLYNSCNNSSSLIALPTGVGKTIVSIMISAEKIDEGKILFMAPSKPLVEQQYESYMEFLDIDNDKIKMINGDIPPNERENIWKENKVFVSTPQVVKNDIIRGTLSLNSFSHLIFDECHKTKGDYAYTYISDEFKNHDGIVTGLSASPGSDKDEIISICSNLGVSNVEVLTPEDDILEEYIHEVDINEVWIELDEETKKSKELIEDYYTNLLSQLKEKDILDSRSKSIPLYKIREAQGKVRKKINNGEADSADYQSLSLLSEAMKLNHCLEIIDCQGLDIFESYVDSMDKDSKAAKRMLENKKFKKAYKISQEYNKMNPKKSHLISLVVNSIQEDKQAIIFSQYRETTEMIVDMFEDYNGIEAHKFVGQSNKENSKGMSQSRQKEVIEEFKNGKHDVLVATSVAEEGLDLPQVETLIMYEPVPSGIRSIQRKGRTGREDFGEVHILIAKDTRDVGYYYSAKNKKDTMENTLTELKNIGDEINKEIETEQKELNNYKDNKNEDKIKVIADNREMSSSVVETLNENVSLEIETLDVGDYIISEECAVERKSVEDLLETIKGERSLFEQAKNLSNEYSKPIYIIEGSMERLYSDNIHDNSIRGILASLTTDFDIRIITSRNVEDTAKLLENIAKREQVEKEDKKFSSHGNKKVKSELENIEYVVSSIKNVGPETATKLLNEFNSISKICEASEKDLQDVDGIGENKAKEIYNILHKNIEEASENKI